jgi:hypothetical protein
MKFYYLEILCKFKKIYKNYELPFLYKCNDPFIFIICNLLFVHSTHIIFTIIYLYIFFKHFYYYKYYHYFNIVLLQHLLFIYFISINIEIIHSYIHTYIHGIVMT